MLSIKSRIIAILIIILGCSQGNMILTVYASNSPAGVSAPQEYNPELRNIRIDNQGSSSECAVNAVSDAIEQQMLRAGLSVPEGGFSKEWLWDMARSTDNKEKGVSIDTVLEVAKTYGLVPEGHYTKNQEKNLELAVQYKIADYELVKKSNFTDTISNGSVIILNTTYQEKNWNDGILTTETENVSGLHATYLVDYNKDHDLFVGVNSWGTKWGYSGLYYMTEDYLQTDVLGGYTVDLDAAPIQTASIQ